MFVEGRERGRGGGMEEEKEGFGFELNAMISHRQWTRNFFMPKIYLFFFSGPHLQHMQVPRLGVESELKLLAYSTATAMQDPDCFFDLHHSSRQCQIPNLLSEANDGTLVLIDTSRICFHWATTRTACLGLKFNFKLFSSLKYKRHLCPQAFRKVC